MLFSYTMKLLINAITGLMMLSLAQSSPTGGASLSGTVVRSGTDEPLAAASDANGRFLFRSVPPGDYRLFGWEALESYAYFDPELLRRVESQGVPVHVSESAGNTVTLKIISASR